MNAAEHLHAKAWKHPQHYGGFSPDGDYVVLTRHRDSELLEEHNWSTACKSLNAEAYDGGDDGFQTRPNVYHWRAGHWAVGWVEYLMVRADAPEEIRTAAGEIVRSLEAYPILDEDGYSEKEWNAVYEYWAECSVSDRVYYLQRARLSIFAARREEYPQGDDSGALFERLREGL